MEKKNATQSYFEVEQNDFKSRFTPATAWFSVAKMWLIMPRGSFQHDCLHHASPQQAWRDPAGAWCLSCTFPCPLTRQFCAMDSSAHGFEASFPLLSQASCHKLPRTDQFSEFSSETKSHCCHKPSLAWTSAASGPTTTVITGSSRTSCGWETRTTLSTIAYSSSSALIRSPGSSLDAQKLLWILNYYSPEFTKKDSAPHCHVGNTPFRFQMRPSQTLYQLRISVSEQLWRSPNIVLSVNFAGP